MTNFWDSNVWSFFALCGVLLVSLLAANFVKKTVAFLKDSLVPTSVLGGLFLLVVSLIYEAIAKQPFFDSRFFSVVNDEGSVVLKGSTILEIITYHALAIGFIATVFKPGHKKFTKEQNTAFFNTGVTTVATYLIQAFLGIGVTVLWALLVKPDFFKAAGAILCFGFGQGTGQALNYGSIYEGMGLADGKMFGLSIAAIGFLCASFGGIIYLSILKHKYGIERQEEKAEEFLPTDIQSKDEIPMNGSIDKLTVQLGIVFGTYLLTFFVMKLFSTILPVLSSIFFGFNFLIGVLMASLVMKTLNILREHGVVKKEYINPFLMKRISGFFFDLMIVAGIAAIRIQALKEYFVVLIILTVVGAFSTFFFNLFVAKKLFPDYSHEQFLAMYGMLTGTASTGIILLREIDPDFKSPVAENLVYQNFPAIVFGFPLMLLAPIAPERPYMTMIILAAFLAVLCVILFRKSIFRPKGEKPEEK